MKLLLIAALVLSGSAMAQYDPEPEPNRCTLQVIIESERTYDDGDAAAEYCSEFDAGYCVVRKYGDSWESRLRIKETFASKNVRDVIAFFNRFIRRSVFIEDGYVSTLRFKNCG